MTKFQEFTSELLQEIKLELQSEQDDELLPDFGAAVYEAQGSNPINLKLIGENAAFLSEHPRHSSITISLSAFRVDVCVPGLIQQAHMVTIELPGANIEQAKETYEALESEGLFLYARADLKYRARTGEQVIPMHVLSAPSDLQAIEKAALKRQRKAAKFVGVF